jgi:Mg2+-importing ATPase
VRDGARGATSEDGGAAATLPTGVAERVEQRDDRSSGVDGWSSISVRVAGTRGADDVLAALGSRRAGLSADDAGARLARSGPNALRTHQVRVLAVLGSQLRSALLGLLFVSAAVSFAVGERSDAVIIAVILAASVGLGFVNELRAARASQALHSRIRHYATVRRDDRAITVDVTELVPGDVVELAMGAVVPADLRVLEAVELECDESVLTGESLPAAKAVAPVADGVALAECTSCVFMGTIVHAGSGVAVVVATGGRTEFGRIALGLGEREPETQFQAGLRDFSALLAKVAGVLTAAILVVNVVLHRPLLDALLFSLAIAVGITPQLLPAIVSTSLAIGSRRLAERKVLVKRLVVIEDLGDVDVLFTDKTGTLTEGRISYAGALDEHGDADPALLTLGLVCNEATVERGVAVSGSPLDVALWEASRPGDGNDDPLAGWSRLATLPFDHDRRIVTVLASRAGDTIVVCKGAPEAVLERCASVPAEAHAALERVFRDGSRVVAVATRRAPGVRTITHADERDLELAGFLCFLDAPKASARGSLERLRALGITVKIVTGDNGIVAEKVGRDLGMPVEGTLNGPDIDALSDTDLLDACAHTTVFARVSPEQKARIITVHRHAGHDVAFLGDGVNDAVALHRADVGISVEGATDVARDAADVVLLENDLGVLADGVMEGRRIFANTVKYVLMGTSSNFGNMFSAAAASAFLRFLPMLPSQILLNNLLYDTSQLAIPTDRVDPEVLERPSHWDVGFIRQFMVFFGPLSSLFDFAMFAVLIGGFRAHAHLFRSGWFIESLATQTLVIFVIRTRRRVFASRPSRALLAGAVGVALLGAVIPISPLHHTLGFARPSVRLYGAIVVLAVAYLALVEALKHRFFERHETDSTRRRRTRAHHVHRLASRWSQRDALPATVSPAPVPPARGA